MCGNLADAVNPQELLKAKTSIDKMSIAKNGKSWSASYNLLVLSVAQWSCLT